MKTKVILAFLCLTLPWALWAADPPTDPARDKEIRERYETVLLKNPFQERAFNSVFDSYSRQEGVDQWVKNLQQEKPEEAGARQVLLGLVYDRQFKTAEAIAALEKAAALGEKRPQFQIVLGTLYYKAGQDDRSAELLKASLDSLTDLEQRSSTCRMLGNIYLRQGKRDEAIAVWKRIAEQNRDEIFAQLELADIYSENRMFDQAIEVYRAIAEASKEDPYRRCRALRSIGQAQVQAERFKEAIATYESALELVSPGNWLFEDLKLRLVNVYSDIGDLAGLIQYLNARIAKTPNELELHDLLAETFTRTGKLAEAEKEYLGMIEKNPRNGSLYEKLINLHTRMGKKEGVVASYEKLMEIHPSDSDYLRRLGEFYLRDGQAAKAKETWQRLLKKPATAEQWSLLGNWYETYEFTDDALLAYQESVQLNRKKESVERLAALQFAKGKEKEAVTLWLSLVDLQKSKPEELTEVASLLEANQKNEEALPLRKAAVEKDPKNLESRLSLAKLSIRLKQVEAALTEFSLLASQTENEFLQQQGEFGRIDAWKELGVLAEKQKELEQQAAANESDDKKLGELARFYERSGQRDKAIQLYEHRLDKQKDHLEAKRALALLYKSNRQQEAAIATLQKLLEEDKNRSRVYYQELLEIYLSLDLKDEAIKAAEQIVSLSPSDPETHLSLAQVYQNYRLPEKALAEYRQAIRLEPNEPDYHRQLGASLEMEKRFGEAQQSYRQMLDTAKEDSTRLTAVAQLARIYQVQNRLMDLTSEFQRRVKNTPKKLAAYEELSTIYREIGQLNKSIEILEEGYQNVDEKSTALKSLIRAAFEIQDFEKVKGYYEQLVKQSGKPTAQEFERLGQIYAQLGQVEKARETWNKMIQESPKDAKAHDRLASVYRDNGFTDEALATKAKAVELDGTDLKRRFDYANMLAQSEQPVEALKQLSLILDQGERELEKKEKESEKKVQPLTRGRNARQVVSPYQFAYGIGNFRSGGYYGQSWYGTFQEFRPQILNMMIGVAQQSIGEDGLIEQLQARIKRSPQDLGAQLDLLMAYQMFNRLEDALKLAEELHKNTPHNADLALQTALFYQAQEKHDKAIEVLENLKKNHPKKAAEARQGLIPLYFQAKQEEKANAEIEAMIKEAGSDIQTLFAIGYVLQNQGKNEKALELYASMVDKDPAYKSNIQYNMASLLVLLNKPQEAAKLYQEVLLGDSNRGGLWVGNPRYQPIYLPVINMANQPRYSGLMRNLPQSVLGYIDYQRGQAFMEMKRLTTDKKEFGDPLADMEKTARQYKNASSLSERNKSWEASRILLANYFNEKQFDQAAQLLTFLRQAGMEDLEWFNASIYLAQMKEDYAAMAKLYDEVAQRFPAKTRQVLQGKTLTFILAKKFDDAARVISQMNQERVPPAEVLNSIQSLIQVGETKLAKKLLEEHLAGVSRNAEALAALADLYARDQDYAKAIELADEAWSRKGQSRMNQGGSYSRSYLSMNTPQNSLLSQLHRYYVAAGKSDALIAQFKDRLDKQPNSLQAAENLAQLYTLSQNQQAALDIYLKVESQRPHLMQIKRSIANSYVAMGDMKKATDVYETLLKNNPGVHQDIAWELRYLYQRMGKGKDLSKMEEKVASKAKDAWQLRELASRYQQEGDFPKALEMFEKAVKLSPNDSYIKNNLAQLYAQMGKLDEAVNLYLEWLNSPAVRSQTYMDHYTVADLVGLFRATGRLDQLTKRCEEELKKNPNDRISKALQAHIAIIEKRFPEAYTHFKDLVSQKNDPNGLNYLLNLARFTGDYDTVLELLPKSDDQDNYSYSQLAQVYAQKGDLAKAKSAILKFIESQMQFGNSGYYIREGMTQFAKLEMWEEVESLYRKNATTAMQEYEARELDHAVANYYTKNQRLTNIVEDILKKDSIKGRDLDLMNAISQQISDPAKKVVFLEKLVKQDPKNNRLRWSLAAAYEGNPTYADKRFEIIQALVKEEPNNAEYVIHWSNAMIQRGEARAVVDHLAKWVAEKPLEERLIHQANLLRGAEFFKDAKAALQKGIEVADNTRKLDAEVRLAEFLGSYGEPKRYVKALEDQFQKRKNSQSFHTLSGILELGGYGSDAHALLVAHKDGGFLDRYQNHTVIKRAISESDYTTAFDLVWQFTRYGEYYNRDQFFQQATNLFLVEGKGLVYARDFEKRVQAEAGRNPVLLGRLAELWLHAGRFDKALALYDELLSQSPLQANFLTSKAQVLIQLGREEEGLKILREQKPALSLDQEISNTIELAGLLFKNKQDAEAEKALTNLLGWAKGSDYLGAVAEIYFQNKKYGQAAALYEKSLKMANAYSAAQMENSLAKTYAKLGKTNEALALWKREHPYNYVSPASIADWLNQEGMPQVALAFVETKQGQDSSLLPFQSEALLSLGKTNEAFQVFQKSLQSGPRVGDVRGQAAGFIVGRQLITEAFQRAKPSTEPEFLSILMAVVSHPAVEGPEASKLALELVKLPVPEKDLAVTGVALLNKAQIPPAIGLFRKAMASTNSEVRLGGAKGLLRVDTDKEKALPILKEFLAKRPTALRNDIELVVAVAKAKDSELSQQFIGMIREQAPNEVEPLYFEMLLAYHGLEKDLAQQKMAEILKSPTLTTAQLHMTLAVATHMQYEPQRKALLELFASGGYGLQFKWESLANLTSLYAQQEDFTRALETFVQLFPAWERNFTDGARQSLVEKVTAANYPKFKEAVKKVLAAAPEHDRVSYLAGFGYQVAQKLEQPDTVQTYLEGLSTTEDEKEEAAHWSQFLEKWELAGPYRSQKPEQAFSPELELKNPQSTVPWKAFDARQVMGIVKPHQLLGLKGPAADGQVIYARTTLESNSDKKTVLSLGCDDWAQVWVNGEKVYDTGKLAPTAPNQRFFIAPLKKGANQVMVKLGNDTDSWGFCLRVVELDESMNKLLSRN